MADTFSGYADGDTDPLPLIHATVAEPAAPRADPRLGADRPQWRGLTTPDTTQPEPPAAWELVGRETVLSAPPFLDVTRDVVRLPDGRVVADYYGVWTPDYALIVAMDERRQVLMLHGYRHGARRVQWGFPAGALDPGESAEAAAQRELLEETGYQADHWQPLGSFVVDGNRRLSVGHFFLARGLRQVRPPQSGDLEDARLYLVAWADALAYVREGGAAEMASAAAIGLVLLHEQ